MYPDEEAALAAWIKQQPDPKPSRSKAVRQLIGIGLKAERREK
jgi:hypothetical protein